MSDNFPAAIKVILGHEGGLTNDKDDHGGITNFGLTIMWLNGHADPQKYVGHPMPWTPDDVRHMTKDLASRIYKECLWDVNHYEKIDDALVATKVFDMAVNFGEFGGEKLAQRACNMCGWQPQLMVDGNVGDKSFAAMNGIERTQLLRSMCARAEERYNGIVEHDPSQKKFLHGWLERARWPF